MVTPSGFGSMIFGILDLDLLYVVGTTFGKCWRLPIEIWPCGTLDDVTTGQ